MGPDGEVSGIVSRGVAEVVEGGVLVSELPLGMWTDDYKTWLLRRQEAGTAAWRRCFNRSSDVSARFHLEIPEGPLPCRTLAQAQRERLAPSTRLIGAAWGWPRPGAA